LTWYRFDAGRGELHLAVHVQPGARSAGTALHGEDALKVRVVAPAVDGRANDALCAYLAVRLGVGQSRVRVVRGASSRRKAVIAHVTSFSPDMLLLRSERDGT
jgi:uncharacterized protein (TIGR00251 family)